MDTKHLNDFREKGYVLLENLYTPEECDEMQDEMKKLIDGMDFESHRLAFDTDKQDHIKDGKETYFLDSVDKLSFFFEKNALGPDNQLLVDRHHALNKVGHGLHIHSEVFKRAVFNDRIKDIFKALDFKKPIIPQSMVIFKQPKIGDQVTNHQDATFLWNNPPKVTGIWIALEDATVKNGCLSFVPGSHKSGLKNGARMVRNLASQDNPSELIFTGDWPYTVPDEEFVAVETPKGSAILIDGFVIHKSGFNTSDKQRPIFTMHVAESHETEWDVANWAQPPSKFTPLY